MTLKSLQINLRHSSTASASLSQLILDLNLDIVFIQEPYVSSFTNTPANTPPGFSSFHALSSTRSFYGAVILARSNLQVKIVNELSSNEIVCVEISVGKRKLQFLSCYCRPSLPNLYSLLDPIFSHPYFDSKNAVIAIDANAHSPIWNSVSCDAKGRELEGLISLYNLNVANLPKSDLPWVPSSTTFVDVTLFGDHLRSLLTEWKFLDFPSLSDHPFIYFSIDLQPSFCRSSKLPKLSQIDFFPYRLN